MECHRASLRRAARISLIEIQGRERGLSMCLSLSVCALYEGGENVLRASKMRVDSRRTRGGGGGPGLSRFDVA